MCAFANRFMRELISRSKLLTKLQHGLSVAIIGITAFLIEFVFFVVSSTFQVAI